MEALLIYLVKSAALIGAFFLAYHFLLRKETFFKSNRWYLIIGLVTSVWLPLVTFKKVIWVETQQVAPINWGTLPVSISGQSNVPAFEINWQFIVAVIYFLGVSIFIMKFLFDCYALGKILKGKTVRMVDSYKLIDCTDNVAPFSFCNYIVYNSVLYSDAEMSIILEHEKVHCRQLHTADVFLARLFCIVFWWNPFVWLYKKAMMQNLEFIADSEAVRTLTNRQSYQITLVKITTHNHCVSITNHFYQSLIKKRIVMLNKNQSHRRNVLKYLLVLPALATFLLSFQVEVVAQEKPATVAKASPSQEWIIGKNFSDADLETVSRQIAEQYQIKLSFSDVSRNDNGEIIGFTCESVTKLGRTNKWAYKPDKPIKKLAFIAYNDKEGDSYLRIGGEASRQDTEDPGYAIALMEMPESPKLKKDPSPIKSEEENFLVIINGTEYSGRFLKDHTVILDGETIRISPEEAVARFGDRASDGAMIFTGKAVITPNPPASLSTGKALADKQPREVGTAPKKAIKDKTSASNPDIEIAHAEMERPKFQIDLAPPVLDRVKLQIDLQHPPIEEAKKMAEEARARASSKRLTLATANGEAAPGNEIGLVRRKDEHAKRDIEHAQHGNEHIRREIEFTRN